MSISLIVLTLITITPAGCINLLAQKAVSTYQARASEAAPLLRSLYPRKVGRTLLEPDERTLRYANDKLLELARRSPEGRREVIDSTIRVLNDPAFYGRFTTEGCRVAGDVLARLKATESIDTLIKHIDHHGLVGGLSLGSYPFVNALITFGETAVPKLGATLLWGKNNWQVRYIIVETLGVINGKNAKAALERALTVERDERVLDVIKRTLPHMGE